MHFVYFIIAVLVIYFFHSAIQKHVRKMTRLKEVSLDTDLKEFRESHAVSQVISGGKLDLRESIVQKYERMCIVDPVKFKNDPSIPGIIAQYNDIISGKVIDVKGENVPSEFLIGKKNPDYQKYLTCQAKALKMVKPREAIALKVENNRVHRRDAEDTTRTMFIAHLVEQGLPLVLVVGAVTDAKLNTYSEDDWRAFCRIVKDYLQMADREVVMSFVETFDDKKIILDANKFESFMVFYEFDIPQEILVELIRDRITPEQAIRMVSLHQDHQYDWDEAMQEVLEDDLKRASEVDLRKQYGWKG